MIKTPVERRKSPLSREEFARRYVSAGVPVVLEGAARDWPAFTRWSETHLRSAIGTESFFYRTSARAIHPSDPGRPEEAHGGFSTFADYLDRLSGPDGFRYYLTGEQVLFFDRGTENAKLRPLRDDFRVPEVIEEALLQYVGFWVSARGVRSWLHYDANGCHNLNAQVVGRKQVLLISPEQGHLLAPYAAASLGPHNFSQLDLERPSPERLPRLSEVHALETTLEPGDALFFPAFWFHSFAHEGELNVNVNFWWSRRAAPLSATSLQWAFADAFARALGKGRPLPPAMLSAALQRLSPETRALVSELEVQLLGTLEQDEHLPPR